MPPRNSTEDGAPPGYVPVHEVEQLITAKVHEATQAMMELLADRGAPAGPAGGDWMRNLAMEIARINDQGRVKRIAPEEAEKREVAQAKLFDMLNDFHARALRGEKAHEGTPEAHTWIPSYKVLRKCFLDEQMIEPLWVHPISRAQMHTTIEWPGVPNEAMEPINEPAQQAYAEFSTWIGGASKNKVRQKVTPRGVVIVEGERPDLREERQVAGPSLNFGLRITGRSQPGAVVETNVLGTIARPARQTGGAGWVAA